MSEGFVEGTVGSITMPHKRNPEISEHLGTLARVVRHNTALIAESQIHDHERDGRAWKSEFAVFSQSAMAFAKILEAREDSGREPRRAPGASDGKPRGHPWVHFVRIGDARARQEGGESKPHIGSSTTRP